MLLKFTVYKLSYCFYLTDPRSSIRFLHFSKPSSEELPKSSKDYWIRLMKSSLALTVPLLSTVSLREEESKCYNHYKEFCELPS